MSKFCFKHNATVEAEFCARRYQKATFNPDDFSLELCRTCADGLEAFRWKESFKDKDNGKGRKFSDRPVIAKKPYKCRFCETPTSSADRVCLKCQLEGKIAPEEDEAESKDSRRADCEGRNHAPAKEKEEIMGGVTSSKICVDCEKEYQPTNNVQKRCPGCKAIHAAKSHKEYDAARYEQRKTQASRERVPRQKKGASIPQGNIGPTESEPEPFPEPFPEIDPRSYIIEVDFRRYPKLHQSLLVMASEDIRTPGDQLMFLLRNTLTEMEDRA